jgi:putative transposase
MISPQDRRHAVDLINKAVADGARAVKACQCLNLAYSTYRKWMNDPDGEDGRPRAIHAPNSKALCIEEKKAVLERYCHPDVCDLSIRQAYYKLLDDGEYLASESTVYRIFRKSNVNVRRDGSRAPVKRNKPTSFEATGPNQVWSWDITYLKDAKHKQRFYYVFAIVDIYSRFVVHADVYDNEGTDNAKQFLETAFKKHHIKPRALVLHSDNGAAMKAAETLAVLQKYKVRQSNSRPRVSNDNPYSESLFKTMKYRGLMGKRQYRSIDDAKDKLKKFVTKYNTQWVHSGINNVTPLCRFLRQDDILQKRRQAVIQSARKRHPCRWIQGQGKQFKTAGSQFLNPDKPKTLNETTSKDRLIDRDFTSGQASQREVAA